MNQLFGIRAIRFALYVFVLIGAIASLFPIVWMFATSFKTYEQALTYPPQLFSLPLTFSGYAELINESGIFRYFGNSMIYAVAGTFLAVLFSSLAGYAFAKYRFKGNRALFLFVLATMMIPGQITLIPVFVLLSDLGWINTFLALIVPGLASPFGIFLIRQFAQGIPDDLIEAARIDGAKDLMIFAKVFIPLCMPAISTLMVLDFMGRWNDLVWPLIVTNSADMKTLQLALTSIARTQYDIKWNTLSAGMVLTFLPIFFLYVFFQKYFTQGIAMTGTK
ncbi:carbohydrate ABC transporter permease [Cohnella boryungensis]|uniref:Carbohydrate ABC transporter permease n=1 Tax=Cohnella boryungensis TaxID=768479 RepID=A0ABV8SHB2_9BACL